MFDEEQLTQWYALRSLFKKAKREKNYAKVVAKCNEIIELYAKADYIDPLIYIFYKEAGSACLELGNKKLAIKNFVLARDYLVSYRQNCLLDHPDDYAQDVNVLDEKIKKINEQC